MKNKEYILSCGDALEFVKKLEPSSIDLVLTSPPYNMGKKYDVYDDTTLWGNYVDNLVYMCAYLFKACKPNSRLIINLANYVRFRPITFEVIYKIYSKTKWHFQEEIIWYKGDGYNVDSSDRYGDVFANQPQTIIDAHSPLVALVHEGIYVFTHIHRDEVLSAKPLDKPVALRSVINFSTNKDKSIQHPCPSPLPLAEFLIQSFSSKGDTVLDPFCGSGTFGVAAVRHNRSFIGYDLSQNYLDICKKRIEKEIKNVDKTT